MIKSGLKKGKIVLIFINIFKFLVHNQSELTLFVHLNSIQIIRFVQCAIVNLNN